MSSQNARLLLILFALTLIGAVRGFAAAPTLTAFSPTSGKLGTVVTITGTNLVAPLTVTFNGVASTSVTVVSSTQATATVPATSTTGDIALKTSGGSVTDTTTPFTIVPGIVFSPSSGPPTSALTLYYSAFGAREALDIYFDTDDIALASASAVGAGSSAFTIPASATPGTHWLTAVGRHSGYSAQVSFLVRTNWPEAGFNSLHNGDNFYENVLTADTVGDLQEAWRATDGAQMETSPAVSGGVAYACFGDGSIRAYNEQTGAKIWSYLTGNSQMFSSPAFANNVVYAGSSDDYLYALDATTGALKWRFQTGGVVYGSPNVHNGLVYFGSYDDKVYALNATTGALVWSYTAGGAVFGTPAVSNGVAYVGSFDGNIYALNATTGALIWQTATMGSVLASPVLTGGLVCVGSEDGKMYALHASDGSTAWTYAAAGAIDTTAAVIGTTLFFGCNEATVYSLSGAGTLRWSFALADGGSLSAPFSTAGGLVYATDGANTFAFTPDTGEILTALPVGNSYGGPVVVNGALLVGDLFNGVLTRYAPNAAVASGVAPRPEPTELRSHPLGLEISGAR